MNIEKRVGATFLATTLTLLPGCVKKEQGFIECRNGFPIARSISKEITDESNGIISIWKDKNSSVIYIDAACKKNSK